VKRSEYESLRFTQKEKIGEGAYGLVVRAWDTRRQMYVAIKRIKTTGQKRDEPQQSLIRSAADIGQNLGHVLSSQCTGLPHFILREISALVEL
jgi:serine/threonine protein kinase